MRCRNARSPDDYNSEEKKKKKEKEKEKVISLVLAVVVGVIDSALLLYYMTVGKGALIVKAHYSGWRTHVAILAVICGVCVANVILKGLSLRKWRQKNGLARAKPEKPATQKAKMDLSTPEGVYDYIEQHGPVEVQRQLDLMNTLQARLDELLAVNHHEASLKEARDLLQAIEDAICLNVRKAINFRIVGGESAFNARVPKLTTENADLLNGAEELLFSLAEFINNGKGDIRAIVQRMKDYRETINEMLEEDDDEKHSEEDSGSGDDYFPTLRARGM